ncbi:branched-chain amino acid ABC transporter ATP-binding protein/permease [Amycolatopsis taiwanensis]|uniref:Branched-chain amino acid ABC transporter permease n=1 Tax=Amycolatopsis taiwanensis TaxID=342230 RepID=A0A9W6QZF0_9PSEU|nr:branched-chain amino acid ABC transporter ATP-binding protein/permease [Amycolatopsis taiwanensis]GLY65428.1 branched-chain amino acid ABC transporter permease [Amycolatopsis taiwanensis]
MVVWRAFRAVPTWVPPLVVAVVVLLLPQLGLDFATSRQVQLACILALVVSGLNLSLGYAGQLALGQAAMYAAGAYTAGLLSIAGYTDILLQLVVAGLVALAVGVLTGIPGLRLGSWSLAMTSFFLVLLVPDVLAMFEDVTGGHNGLSGIEGPTLFGAPLDTDGYYVVIVVVAIVWFAVLRNIVVSRHGVAFRVLKQSPVLASSVGISVFRMKLLGYALGAFPVGLAGALFANLDGYLSPETFTFTLATSVLAASILGGSASVYGAAVGAAIMQLGPNQSSAFQQYALVFYGAFLILGGVLLGGGLAQLFRGLVTRLDRRAGLAPSRTAAPPGQPPEVPALRGAELAVSGLSKAFGGNQALRDVSIIAAPGRVTALIGPNGSGKTTLLNMISGFYRTDAGRIALDDGQIQRLPAHRVARAGVARTFQTPNLPAGVTVAEAVASGRYSTHRASTLGAVLRLPRFRRIRAADIAEAERVLELVGLAHLRDAEAVSLPLGNRRLLEVARALVTEPKVLLLDEAASGLDEDEVDRLAELIRRIRDAGGTVLLVEHNFRLILALADEIFVLAHGQVIASGPPEVIERDPRVLNEYLGVRSTESAESSEAMDTMKAGER